jgi:hypothetical protein
LRLITSPLLRRGFVRGVTFFAIICQLTKQFVTWPRTCAVAIS